MAISRKQASTHEHDHVTLIRHVDTNVHQEKIHQECTLGHVGGGNGGGRRISFLALRVGLVGGSCSSCQAPSSPTGTAASPRSADEDEDVEDSTDGNNHPGRGGSPAQGDGRGRQAGAPSPTLGCAAKRRLESLIWEGLGIQGRSAQQRGLLGLFRFDRFGSSFL
ncbi:hypothetical protein Taro_016931 [Colocasia esculenta]|uniref:Uncharacterized protein n=1 Tax=Colocasia esculenta TaxID=4460 RepID=A0A843ULR6_COLES|nr:hypothetical protein [Colocasia esculenta]